VISNGTNKTLMWFAESWVTQARLYFSVVQLMCKEMTLYGLTVSSVLEMKDRLLFVLMVGGQMEAV